MPERRAADLLRQSAFPELADYVGDDLIVTDGTSLLGADDKAAIAAIMHALQHLQANPQIVHGPVKVGFVPDEEQGCAAPRRLIPMPLAPTLPIPWTAAASANWCMKTGTPAMSR